MTLARTAFYDAETETLWVARRFFEANARISKEEVMQWMELLEGGVTDDGRPVQQVNYLFLDHSAAATNYVTLQYAGVGVYFQEGGNRLPYYPEGDEPRFEVRSDLGFDLDLSAVRDEMRRDEE